MTRQPCSTPCSTVPVKVISPAAGERGADVAGGGEFGVVGDDGMGVDGGREVASDGEVDGDGPPADCGPLPLPWPQPATARVARAASVSAIRLMSPPTPRRA